MQHVFSFPIRNSSCGMLIQQFPLNATIFLASLSEIFVESCLCNNFQVMQQFLAIRIFLEACLCNNFQILQQFLAFLSELLPDAYLCNNFLGFLSESFLEDCLYNNFQCMQQFFTLTIRHSSWFLIMQNFPAYATIFQLSYQKLFLRPAYATM